MYDQMHNHSARHLHFWAVGAKPAEGSEGTPLACAALYTPGGHSPCPADS